MNSKFGNSEFKVSKNLLPGSDKIKLEIFLFKIQSKETKNLKFSVVLNKI